MKTRKRVLRGFTLIEMIIVLAIIAIIAGVFIPAINRYITRSRLNASNADARVIFNSLQTICQEIEFSDRTAETCELYGLKYYNDSFRDNALDVSTSNIVLCAEAGVLTKAIGTNYYKKSNPARQHGNTSDSSKPAEDYDPTLLGRLDDTTGATNNRLMQRMYRLYDSNGETYWCAYIEGYLVKGVICANKPDSEYLGGYPLKSTEKGGFTTRSNGSSVECPFLDAGGSFTMQDVVDNCDVVMAEYVKHS